MSVCPHCGDKGAYLGFVEVKCANAKCAFFDPTQVQTQSGEEPSWTFQHPTLDHWLKTTYCLDHLTKAIFVFSAQAFCTDMHTRLKAPGIRNEIFIKSGSLMGLPAMCQNNDPTWLFLKINLIPMGRILEYPIGWWADLIIGCVQSVQPAQSYFHMIKSREAIISDDLTLPGF